MKGNMLESISKSMFKPRALQYFREIERTGKGVIITDRGKPVLKIVPYSEDAGETLRDLRNSVIKYENPFDPVGIDEWESLSK